ncbi:MAG: DNA alkylation repair protein [Solirubrobacterales bacterium]
MSAAQIKREVGALADPVQAKELQRFFKTGPGDYGEGDVFVGVKVPPLRKIAKGHRDEPLAQIEKLLVSRTHEHRTVALVILTEQAARADLPERRRLYDFYLAHTDRINNWDLVDISCREVVGGYLLAAGDWSPLQELAASDDLWERRIAMVSTWQFIRAGQLEPTFALATMLIDDDHDLMHKAVGWMLREAGKKDEARLDQFLAQHAARMPRTALRYSIERMPPEKREHWRKMK